MSPGGALSSLYRTMAQEDAGLQDGSCFGEPTLCPSAYCNQFVAAQAWKGDAQDFGDMLQPPWCLVAQNRAANWKFYLQSETSACGVTRQPSAHPGHVQPTSKTSCITNPAKTEAVVELRRNGPGRCGVRVAGYRTPCVKNHASVETPSGPFFGSEQGTSMQNSSWSSDTSTGCEVSKKATC